MWTFADISTCPLKRGGFPLSFAPKFKDFRRPGCSGEQIAQETIFVAEIPAGSQKKLSPQGLSRIFFFFYLIFVVRHLVFVFFLAEQLDISVFVIMDLNS